MVKAKKGAKAKGGGYGPFVKISGNSWKNPKTGLPPQTNEMLRVEINKDDNLKDFPTLKESRDGGKGIRFKPALIKAKEDPNRKVLDLDELIVPSPSLIFIIYTT